MDLNICAKANATQANEPKLMPSNQCKCFHFNFLIFVAGSLSSSSEDICFNLSLQASNSFGACAAQVELHLVAIMSLADFVTFCPSYQYCLHAMFIFLWDA
jgi:hypothetical protein